jgi:hypothetical protein
MPRAARRTAALLLPGCRMKYGRFEFSDTTAFSNLYGHLMGTSP